MKRITITALALTSLSTLATADDFFINQAVFGQSNFVAYPRGFWVSGSNTYAADLELKGNPVTDTNSRWYQPVQGNTELLQNALSTPTAADSSVAAANTSGICCGWARIDSTTLGPVTWDAGSLPSSVAATPIPPIVGSTRKSGEALMINNAGWSVGYFAASQGLSPSQDPFVRYDASDTYQLTVPSGFLDGRAICINGKTSTPGTYRIGGWKRLDGGVTHAMLWKKSGSSWVEETINDPDNVLQYRITWIADVNDNGVCVGRIETIPDSFPQTGEYLYLNEPGGLFIYDPNDKVRRINLPGLAAATPVRINNNNEIAVNREDNGTLAPYFVVPSVPGSSTIRGSVIDFVALRSPDATYSPSAVYEFKDDRRWCGIAASNPAHVAKKDNATYSSVAPTAWAYTGFDTSTVTGDLDSLGTLDGNYAQLYFSGTGEHSVEVQYTASGTSVNGFRFMPTIRCLTAGTYTVSFKIWKWTLNGGNGDWENYGSSNSLYSDFSTPLSSNYFGTTDYYIHNGNIDTRFKMVFTVMTTQSSPGLQIEKAGWARK